MSFVAIDFETANADMASICQIGLVKCDNGVLSDEWRTYVDPGDYFDSFNVSIHGIDESDVKGAPTFPELADTLRSHLEGKVVVCHTHFDRVAMHQATQRYGVSAPECTWLDSASVARRAWKECAWKEYGLHNVCRILGYEFKHHNALEDAKAAAHVLLAATNEIGLDIDGWLRRVRQPINPTAGSSAQAIRREGNPEGALYGEVLVYTGALEIPRREAADLAAAIGCQVASGVTKNTTMLVVGDQDIKKLAGHEKSAKHRKAEDLNPTRTRMHGVPLAACQPVRCPLAHSPTAPAGNRPVPPARQFSSPPSPPLVLLPPPFRPPTLAPLQGFRISS